MLVERGKQIILEAVSSKESGNQTFNQLDSYGLVIYYNGKVQRSLIGSQLGTSNYRAGLPYNISTEMTAKNKRFAKWGEDGEGRHKGWPAMGVPAGTGYEWARMFIKEFGKAGDVPQRGFALVVFNAAFYSQIQEHGGGTLKKTYAIISQVVGDLDNIGKDFGARTSRTFGL